MLKQFLIKRKIKKYARKMPKKLAAEFGNKSEYTEEEVEVILKLLKLYKNDRVGNTYAIAMYCSKKNYVRYLASSHGVEDYGAVRELIRSIVFPEASGFNFSSLLIDASSPYESSEGDRDMSFADYSSDSSDSAAGSD